MKATNSFKFSVVALVLIIIATFNIAVIYNMFYQKPWLTYENLPFPPMSIAGEPGQILPLLVKRCNNDSVPHVYEVTHSLESVGDNPRYYLLESQVLRIAPGCSEAVSLANRLPKQIPPGEYRLFGAAEIHSGFRSFQVEWHSAQFIVK
jgi:hypothetical protein